MPGHPPKAWFSKMKTEISQTNPDYSDEQVDKTVGDIWHNKLSPSKKDDIIKRYESVKTTALDRNIFKNMHNDFKDSIQSRIFSELNEAYENGQLNDFNSFYENTYKDVIDYLIPIYEQAMKDELTQLSNSIKEEIKIDIKNSGFENITSSADEKDMLIKSIKTNATVLFLYSTLKRLIRSSNSKEDFTKVAVQLSQQELNDLMEILKSMQDQPQTNQTQQPPGQLPQKKPLTQQEVEDLIAPLQKNQQPQKPQQPIDAQEVYDERTPGAKV